MSDDHEAGEAPEMAEVRAEVRAWLQENWDPAMTLGDWWKGFAESGWAFPSWPTEWYGRGLDAQQASVVTQEARAAGVFGPPSGISVMMAGPTIIEHGTEEQRRAYLPSIVSGKEVWCQLFSEPGAGSDLAGLQTRAVRDGDEWVVNGQKVWTSGAQHSRWGILIARTDPEVPKHTGITYFIIDMEQPGVDVRPLREMTGGATFNEVFFNNARVPHDNVVGEVNGGWGVALTTLAHERSSLGAGSMGGLGGGSLFDKHDLDQSVAEVMAQPAESSGLSSMGAGLGGGGEMIKLLPALFGRNTDPIVRQGIASMYTLLEIARYTGLRSKAAAARGERPGPEFSTGKLMASVIVRELRDFALGLEGPAGMLAGTDAPLDGALQMLLLFSPAVSIAGGTDEVQHNIIGERVLGLPAEPRLDKTLPWNELKIGTQRTR